MHHSQQNACSPLSLSLSHNECAINLFYCIPCSTPRPSRTRARVCAPKQAATQYAVAIVWLFTLNAIFSSAAAAATCYISPIVRCRRATAAASAARLNSAQISLGRSSCLVRALAAARHGPYPKCARTNNFIDARIVHTLFFVVVVRVRSFISLLVVVVVLVASRTDLDRFSRKIHFSYATNIHTI